MFSDKAGSDIWYTWLVFLLRAGPWCQRNLVTAWESRLSLTESYALFNSILKFHYWDGRLEKPSIELGMTSSLTVESLCFPAAAFSASNRRHAVHVLCAWARRWCHWDFAHGRWRARYQRNENQGEFPWHSMIQPSRKNRTYIRRKFRRQTSDNMDRWKAQVGTVREEKGRIKKIREEKAPDERRCRRAKR